ncbi:hypothetical protein CGCS363_v008602 [Colletotrichum siamense]|uniref:uncharacterized protein n=1 Tax=Colletotrichum siamense TaxID=690259 RepID=UPI001872820E|nr:uncharacterized protein CGCS363_v008602 [Colletotrichum siamense]KAF5497103.1 hypothetical protein CGCS363_v008602 [Colletotrichum siamense]
MAHPEYAHPQQVPSSEEVERLEKMIAMLSDIQSKHLKRPESAAIRDDFTLSKAERRFVRKQHDYLDCIAVLSPEPLALFPDGSVDASTGSHYIFASENPRREDKAKQQYTGLQPQLTLPQINGSLVPDSTDSSSVIKFAYRLLAKEDWEQRSNNSTFQYCQNLLSLWKKFHGAAKSDERFHWLNLLHDLVYVRMTEKLHGRVIDIFEKHNFGTICMTSVDQLASQFKATSMGKWLQQSLRSTSDPLTELDLIESMPFQKGGATNPQDELEHCFRKGQTQAQSTLLKQIYKEMQVRYGRGTAEEGERAWERSSLNAKGDPEYVFYDEKGRSEFQKLLSGVMRAVKDSTTELQNAKTEATNYARRTSKGTKNSTQQTMERYHIESLQYVVDAAVRAYYCLAGIREEFSEILQSHYTWLYATHQPGVSGIDAEGTDDCRLLGSTATQSGWEVAVSDAVGMLCRHQTSLNHIMHASRHVARFVLQTSIQPLVTDWTKRNLMSTAELLASFKGNNGKPLSNEEQLALAEFFDGHNTAHSEDLTYHAEGIGICAHVLARVRDEVVNHNDDHETVDKSLLLPRREITDHFRKMPIPMAVNKRCCAGLERRSIPRWIPKKFFNSLYDQVGSVLRDALRWTVKEKGLARSNESGNSSDPNGDSARFIARMTMCDKGGRPRPVKPQEPEEP